MHLEKVDELSSRLGNLFSVKSLQRDHLRIYTLLILIVLVFSVCFYFSSNAVIIDSDSGFEYTNAQNVLDGKGLEHGPVVQQLLYALILGIFGRDHRNILVFQSILTTLLVLVTFLFVRRKTSFNVAIIASLLFLFFPIFYWGTYTLKPYPLFLLLLMLTVYSFDRYMENREGRFLLISAVSLGLATMTHLISLPFVGLILLYYLLGRIRGNTLTLVEVAKFYILALLVVSPYVTWRIMMDGMSLDLLLTYPAKWHTIKYGLLANEQFWGFPLPFTYEYYYRLLGLLVTWAFSPGLLVFLLWGLAEYDDKKFFISWLLVLLAPFFVGRGVVISFYAYPFLPLILSLSAQGIHTFLRLHNSRRIKIFVIGLIVAIALTNYSHANSIFESRINRVSPEVQDIEEFSTMIPEGSNILFRSRAPSPHLPHKNVLMIQDLTEEDALTYLDWKDDEEVANVFMKYNISYVILYKDIRWERDYHVWFEHVTGHEPSHFYRINESQYFEKAKEGNAYILYKFIKPIHSGIVHYRGCEQT